MQIKITDKILSIAPYLSTCWSRIATLHMKGSVLVVSLNDGDVINIPNLPNESIEQIFTQHAAYFDNEKLKPIRNMINENSLQDLMNDEADSSFRLAFGSIDGLSTALQHNSSQSDAPNLPHEMLEKISAIAKIMGTSEEISLPQAEPHCNCFHCQIARTLNPESHSPIEQVEDISDDELQFQDWKISQIGDQLFSVTNRLNEHEKYNVYLGTPIGCTCGQQGCEHILAVLKS
jgi:molybdopterin-guanine dinucleotide biosynthesis protein A